MSQRATLNERYGAVADTIRIEGTRILATLIRTVGDVQLAEDAVQEAALAALGAWPVTGVPPEPRLGGVAATALGCAA